MLAGTLSLGTFSLKIHYLHRQGKFLAQIINESGFLAQITKVVHLWSVPDHKVKNDSWSTGANIELLLADKIRGIGRVFPHINYEALNYAWNLVSIKRH